MLVLPSLLKRASVVISLWILALSGSHAQELPQQCVQLPTRQQACTNLLYKRAPVDVPTVGVSKGEIVCICMADFASLRIKASTEQGKIAQLVEVSRLAVRLNIGEQQLLSLLRD